MKECNSCGKCCIKYGNGGLSASKHEIETWEDHAPHIYPYVHKGNIWMDPNTKQQIERCPWLKVETNTSLNNSKLRYSCEIYFDRPDDCRLYPSTLSEMILDECEMIELKDITHPKKAQKALDEIMADSRSAC